MIEFSENCPKCIRPRALRLDVKTKVENAKISERCTDRAGCVAAMRKRMAAQIQAEMPKLKAAAAKAKKKSNGKGKT